MVLLIKKGFVDNSKSALNRLKIALNLISRIFGEVLFFYI
jgi:hypothetical protein